MKRKGYKSKSTRINHDEVVRCYKKHEDISVVGKELGISVYILKKILKLNNIPVKKPLTIIDTVDQAPIVKLYTETRNTKLVARQFGLSVSSTHKILHHNNIKVTPMKYTDVEIIQKYLQVGTIDDTSKMLNLSRPYVLKIVRKYKVRTLKYKARNVGDVFDMLRIIEELEPSISSVGHKRREFLLICECGTLVKRNANKLVVGKKMNCGCVIIKRKPKTTRKQLQ